MTGITGAAAQPAQPFIHVTLMGTNPANNAPLSIIVTGCINAGGVDHQGTGKNTDTAVFQNGTFQITHSPPSASTRSVTESRPERYAVLRDDAR